MLVHQAKTLSSLLVYIHLVLNCWKGRKLQNSNWARTCETWYTKMLNLFPTLILEAIRQADNFHHKYSGLCDGLNLSCRFVDFPPLKSSRKEKTLLIMMVGELDLISLLVLWICFLIMHPHLSSWRYLYIIFSNYFSIILLAAVFTGLYEL